MASALVPILQETELLARKPEVDIHSRDVACWGGLATVDGYCRMTEVSLSVWVKALALWCRGPSKSRLCQMRCMETAVHSCYQLSWRAFWLMLCHVVNVVSYQGRVGGVREGWVPGTGSHHHSKFPGLPPAPGPLQESSQKVGDVSYSGSVTLPWLAGTPRDL